MSEAAAEIVRVEHGRPRYGIDLDETVIPQEAGLNERAVSFTKGCYVGQETVARSALQGQAQPPPARLRLSAPPARARSCAWASAPSGISRARLLSPVHGPIGLALVRREAEPGATISVGERGVSAEVIELPFAAR